MQKIELTIEQQQQILGLAKEQFPETIVTRASVLHVMDLMETGEEVTDDTQLYIATLITSFIINERVKFLVSHNIGNATTHFCAKQNIVNARLISIIEHAMKVGANIQEQCMIAVQTGSDRQPVEEKQLVTL